MQDHAILRMILCNIQTLSNVPSVCKLVLTNTSVYCVLLIRESRFWKELSFNWYLGSFAVGN